MIQKNLDVIVAADIDALVSSQIREGRTIEYKLELPGGKDEDKKELLADVSSFANTVGGDLIFGVEEDRRLPIAVKGIPDTDLDAALLRLESIIATGLDPRIRYVARLIEHTNGKVLLLRIDESWIGPHRVTFKGHDKFYARNSAGKYPLDVTELRDAFLRSSAAGERIHQFRETRLLEIAAEHTPVPLKTRTRIVLPMIPLQAFTTRSELGVNRYYHERHLFRPIGALGWSGRINVDGVVTYDGGTSPYKQYAQLYRSGIIEAVDAYLGNLEQGGRRQLPSTTLEQRIMESVRDYLGVLRALGARTPIYVFLSLLEGQGLTLAAGDAFFDMGERYALDRKMLALSEVTFLNFEDDVGKTLRPIFDTIWNAFGYEGSRNCDSSGVWKPK